MKIIDAEIIGCRFFKLGDIRRLKLNFNQLIQVILGTNGSGKSVLVHLLTPLPANPKYFHPEGSVTITILHRGITYVVKSMFSRRGAKYSFNRAGVELNGNSSEGGTATAQKDLVKQHFGITPEIQQLLTGELLFTEMGSADRRKWMMLLSDCDWDYALSVYKKLQTHARDVEGDLRRTKKRLVEEVEKVIQPAEEKKLNDEINQIYRELNALMEERAPIAVPAKTLEERNNARMAELQRLSMQLLRMRFVAPLCHRPDQEMQRDEWGQLVRPNYLSVEEIEAVIDEIRHSITSKEAHLAGYFKNHKKLSEQLETLQKSGDASVAALRDQIEKKRELRLALHARRHLKLEGFSPKEALAALDNLKDVLADIFSHLPNNAEREYSSEKMQVAEQEHRAATDKIALLEKRLAFLVNKKEHADQHRNSTQTECPKCTHRWVVGYSEQQYQAVLDEIEKLDTELGAARIHQGRQKALYDTNKEYGDLYRSFFKLKQSWSALNPFWDYVVDNKLITHKPQEVLHAMNDLHHDLELEIDMLKIEDEIKELMLLVQAKEAIGDASVAKVREEFEECVSHIERLTTDLTNLRRSESEHQAYRRQMVEAIELTKRIETLRNEASDAVDEIVETIRLETIHHCIRQLQTALARKEETLSYVSMQKGLVEDLRSRIAQMEIEDAAAKLLVSELSPTEGLIADGLVGFIHSFLGQMNSLIKKIWTYPLIVMDCVTGDTQSTELDYKFPLAAPDTNDPADDVKYGSKSQKEIVNLAFKVTAMSRLKLLDSPLFLDEFATSFDPAHRQSASSVINLLMEQKPFTQLFMVSHYEESYGVFNNAEFCVLCPSNIVIPSSMNYNQHVTIE